MICPQCNEEVFYSTEEGICHYCDLSNTDPEEDEKARGEQNE